MGYLDHLKQTLKPLRHLYSKTGRVVDSWPIFLNDKNCIQTELFHHYDVLQYDPLLMCEYQNGLTTMLYS
jgi:hypothetical protein